MRLKPMLVLVAIIVAAGVAVPVLRITPEASAGPVLRTAPAPRVSRDAARRMVRSFFVDVNSGRFAAACSVLGEELLNETGGADCPRFLAVGASQPRRFVILGTRRVRSLVAVDVILDHPELDHVRRLRWIASVGFEAGELKILETRRAP